MSHQRKAACPCHAFCRFHKGLRNVPHQARFPCHNRAVCLPSRSLHILSRCCEYRHHGHWLCHLATLLRISLRQRELAFLTRMPYPFPSCLHIKIHLAIFASHARLAFHSAILLCILLRFLKFISALKLSHFYQKNSYLNFFKLDFHFLDVYL